MAKGTGSASDIQPVGADGMFAHESHCHNGEGFIHLPQIDVGRFPFKVLQKLSRRQDRRNREKSRLRGDRALAGNSRKNWRIAPQGLIFTGQRQCGGAI